MNVVKEILSINELELSKGITGTSGSWHEKYADSSWVYVGNLPPSLTEGDVLCVLSQFGEAEAFHMPRDDATGRQKGFAFLKYEDFRSAVVAVDNLTGAEVLGRTIRVDHTANYKPPKKKEEEEGEGKEKEEEKRRKEEEMEQVYGGGGTREGGGEGEGAGKKKRGFEDGVDLFAPEGDSSGEEGGGGGEAEGIPNKWGGAGYEMLGESGDEGGGGKKAKKEKKQKKEKKVKGGKEKKEKKVKKESKRQRADSD
ncbi:hypothetical protein TeGR_g10519 [Tetraparma gracilis]|uniref:RRM domain-containing protein n=1 Tax=Tetraparma gracilis TaxID=2962635 RepID=A0ABQ6ND42_9STRA|nr:hypothetical protein TeGR_g10519 [Tetraparma gracilis]